MKGLLNNKRGSALLTAVIAFCVLLIISISVSTLSITNINMSVKSKEHNNTYYLAEAAVQKGLQHIKDKTAQYYEEMWAIAESTGYSQDYIDQYDGFFVNITANAAADYIEPVFKDSAYLSAATQTRFFLENVDTAANTADFVAESTATMPDNTARTVRGVLNMTRFSVVTQSGSTYDPSDNVLTVGGNMVFYDNSNTQEITVNDGTIEIGGYRNKNEYKSLNPESMVTITPGLGDAMTNDLTYASLLQKRSTTVTRYVTASTSPTYLDQGSPTELHYLEGEDGLSFTITGGSYYGQVYCRNGDLNIQSGNYYGNVFCDGNVSLNSAQVIGNIVAGGNINISGGTYGGVISGGKLISGAFFAGGDININGGGTLVDAFVYAKNNFNMNSNPAGSAIIFSGGNINVNVSNTFSYDGTMTAKGDFILHSDRSCWHTLNNDPVLAAAAAQHDWYGSFFGTTSYTMQPVNVDDLVNSEKIYET